MTAADEIAAAVRAWLDGLDDEQRAAAVFPFDTNERFVWAYTPGIREGLALRDMSPAQRDAATAIVGVALSERTAAEVASVIALETVLGALEREGGRGGWTRRDPELYWFAVFGEPDARAPWSWRIGGHHVAIHVTLADGQVIGSAPSFLGANPAVVPFGPQVGFRALPGEETLARTLLAGLTPDERSFAIVDDQAPADILTENAARTDARLIPVGIPYRDLAATARAVLEPRSSGRDLAPRGRPTRMRPRPARRPRCAPIRHLPRPAGLGRRSSGSAVRGPRGPWQSDRDTGSRPGSSGHPRAPRSR